MKFVIFGALAFVLGLGGSTGVMVLTTPVRLTAADSASVHHADSTHVAAPVQLAGAAPASAPAPVAGKPAPRETTLTPVPQHPMAAVAPGAVASVATAGPHAPEVTKVTPPAESGVHEGKSATLPDGESYKQVGSILLNMKPAEAGKIVGYLTDDQVEGLLRSMSPRQAAGVLGQLPPERAAALSRRLLAPAKAGRP